MIPVAVIQAAPVAFDLAATLDRTESLCREAHAGGAQLIVFPEAFLGGYPKGADFGVRGTPDVDCLQCNRCLVGERTGPAPAWRVNAFRAALVASLLLLALFALPSDEASKSAPSLEPHIRSVNVARLKSLTADGRLSDKPADYWHVVRENDTRVPE